jgi:uncharacterized protein (TIGR03382 family)
MSPTTLSRYLRKSLFTAAIACLSVTSAQAADADLGALGPLSATFQIGFEPPAATFMDELSFDLAMDSIASFTIKGEGFTIPGLLTLSGSPDVTFALYKGGVAVTGFDTVFTDLSLVAGTDYSFMVKGKTGGYLVAWSTAPVPESGAIAMAVAGLAMAGALTRRRAKRG